MATDGQGRVPDILLERYLAGDLSQEQRRQIEAERDASEDVRRRLEKLEEERAAFLAVDPPEQFAHRLAARLSVEAEAAAPRRRRWWAWILAPSAAAAATLLVTVTVVNMRMDAPSPSTSALEQSELVGDIPPASERPVEAKRDGSYVIQETAVEFDRGAEDADLSGTDEAPRRLRQRFRAAKRRAGRATGARRLKDQAAGETTAFSGSDAGASRAAGAGVGAASPEPVPQPGPVPTAGGAADDSAKNVAPRDVLAAPPPPATSPALVTESEVAPMPEPVATREPAAPVSRSAPPEKPEQTKPVAKPRAKPRRDAKKARVEKAASSASPGPQGPGPPIGAGVMRVLRKNSSKLNECVEKSRRGGDLPANLKNITLELTIATTGKVAKVAVAPKARVPKPLARCIRKVLGPVVFPRSNEAQTVTIPMRL